MHARHDQVTLSHVRKIKKEDIICRAGSLAIRLWRHQPNRRLDPPVAMNIKMDGELCPVHSGECVIPDSGSRAARPLETWHEFLPDSDECIIGEVSAVNGDRHDNVFANLAIGCFSVIDEDESASARLVSGD